jgi:hypothetical protein
MPVTISESKSWWENLKRRGHNFNRHAWEDTIKTNLKETGSGDFTLSSSDSGYGPITGSCGHGTGPSSAINGGEFSD